MPFKIDEQKWADAYFNTVLGPFEKIGVNFADMSDEEPMLVSPDGLFSVEPVECLANCGFGPNVMVNEVLYSQVTTKKIDEIIAKYQPKK